MRELVLEDISTEEEYPTRVYYHDRWYHCEIFAYRRLYEWGEGELYYRVDEGQWEAIYGDPQENFKELQKRIEGIDNELWWKT